MDVSAFPNKCFAHSQITSVIPKDLIDLQPQHNSILTYLNNQRTNGLFCDVALYCRGEIIHAHRCVLACASRYFETLFTTPLSTNTTPVHIVHMDEYSPEVVRILVNLMYTRVDIPYTLIIELLQLAIFVHYDGLVKVLVQTIRPLINDTNVWHWFDVAHGYGCDELIWLTECFVREDYAKLHWKAMLDGTNVKDKLNYVRNSKLRRETKDLVYILTEHKNGFVLDVEKMLLSSYHPEQGSLCGCILNKNTLPSLLTTFVWNGTIFAISANKKDSMITKKGRKHLVVKLLKYRHCSSTLECVETYKFCHLECTLVQAYFDGKESVYLQVEKTPDSGRDELLFYKVDMITGRMHEGYVNMGSRDLSFMQMLFRLQEGMYYISLKSILKVSDFDFDQTESNTAEEISLCSMISGLEPVSRARHREGPILYQSCNGTGYCVLPPKTMRDQEQCILKLDVGKLTWVLVSRFNCHFAWNMRVCNQIMYLECSTILPKDKVFYFDETTEELKETNLQIPEDVVTCFNFPAYL